jgi:uncharacterized cupredoxin-like copper-binding protein
MRSKLMYSAALALLTVVVLVISSGCGSGSSGTGSQHEPGDTSIHNIPSLHDVDPPYEEEDLQATAEARDAGVPSVRVTAEHMKFTPDRIQLPAGERVIITLQNNADSVEHDLQVDGLKITRLDGLDRPGEHIGVVSSTLALHTRPNWTARLTFRTEQRGTFDFYCTMPGHREAGMAGTLTVS